MNKISYYKLLLKAIGNETRAEIINLLKSNPKNVSQICAELKFEQSRVSHALKCLTNCGFVSAKWGNGNKIYSLNGEIKPILGAIDRHITKYQKRLKECGILKT